MKTGIWIAFLIVALSIGFGSGLLVGRQFPAHRYERFGETIYLFDSVTGKACNPFKDPAATTNLFDQGLTGEKDANGLPITKASPSYPPACGK